MFPHHRLMTARELYKTQRLKAYCHIRAEISNQEALTSKDVALSKVIQTAADQHLLINPIQIHFQKQVKFSKGCLRVKT